MWNDLLLLAIAGAIGTLTRFTVAVGILRMCGDQFPWATLVINMTGCFLFGLVWSLTETRLLLGAQSRQILLTGFMGAYTTFSTFAFDTSRLIVESQYLLAAANGLGQVTFGVVFLFIGLAIGRMF